MSLQPGLVGQPEVLRGRAGRDDDGPRTKRLAICRGEFERPDVQLRFENLIELEAGAKARHLLLHDFHQVGSHDSVLETREVLDLGRDGQLPAGLHSFEDQGLEAGPRRVQRRGQARGPEPRMMTFSICSALSDTATSLLDGQRRTRCGCTPPMHDDCGGQPQPHTVTSRHAESGPGTSAYAGA